MDMLSTKTKRELQSFLGIVNYLSKFSPTTTEICEPLKRLNSVIAAWTWYRSYQKIYETAKSSVEEDTCMKTYDARKPLYLETDASGLGLRATLLQVRDNLNNGYSEGPDNAYLALIG